VSKAREGRNNHEPPQVLVLPSFSCLQAIAKSFDQLIIIERLRTKARKSSEVSLSREGQLRVIKEDVAFDRANTGAANQGSNTVTKLRACDGRTRGAPLHYFAPMHLAASTASDH
jgi:hypothetical protein